MNQQIPISVVMPVYNEPKDRLINAINSILNQTYKDFEFIIIDDGSEDHVEKTIQMFSDSRINYVKNSENKKIVATMNLGFSIAKGKYIAIMHSDDISLPKRLEKQYVIMENYPNVCLVNSYSLLRKQGNERINFPQLNNYELKSYLKYIGNNIICPNTMLRKSIIDEHSLTYKEEFVLAEDYQMWNDIMKFGDFYTIPEVLTIYNINANPSRQNFQKQKLCAKKLILKNYLDYLNLPENYFWIKDLDSWRKISNKNFLLLKEKLKTLPESIKDSVSKDFYYSFLNDYQKTLEDFNPNKEEQNELFEQILF